MIGILRHRNFARLWFGQLLSVIGDWMLYPASSSTAGTAAGPWSARICCGHWSCCPLLLLPLVGWLWVVYDAPPDLAHPVLPARPGRPAAPARALRFPPCVGN